MVCQEILVWLSYDRPGRRYCVVVLYSCFCSVLAFSSKTGPAKTEPAGPLPPALVSSNPYYLIIDANCLLTLQASTSAFLCLPSFSISFSFFSPYSSTLSLPLSPVSLSPPPLFLPLSLTRSLLVCLCVSLYLSLYSLFLYSYLSVWPSVCPSIHLSIYYLPMHAATN